MPDHDLSLLIRDLGKVPQELRRQLGKELRAAAEPIAATARRGASWSRRIPSAIRVSSQFATHRPGIRIRVSRALAPHARPLEGITRGAGSFRHPVFGRDTWVTQTTRPFLLPAVESNAERVTHAVGAAIDASARLHGWR